jgi:hypothetical protein
MKRRQRRRKGVWQFSSDILVVAEFDGEGDILLTAQDGLFVAESENGLIAIGGSGNEAFFNLGMAYRNAGLMD